MSRGPDRTGAASDGVLTRLPRSRPGQRSDKRTGRSGGDSEATSPGDATGARGGTTRRRSGRPTAGSPASARTAGARTSARAAPGGADAARGPIGEAAHLAGRAARLGLDV